MQTHSKNPHNIEAILRCYVLLKLKGIAGIRRQGKSCFQDFITMGLNVARKTSEDGKNVDIILNDMQFLIGQQLDSLVEK